MVMTLEKFRLRKVDPLPMHGGQRREGSDTLALVLLGCLKCRMKGRGKSPRNGEHFNKLCWLQRELNQ